MPALPLFTYLRRELHGEAVRLSICQLFLAYLAGRILDREISSRVIRYALAMYRVLVFAGGALGSFAGALGAAALALGGVWLSGRMIGELIVLALR